MSLSDMSLLGCGFWRETLVGRCDVLLVLPSDVDGTGMSMLLSILATFSAMFFGAKR